MNTMMSQPFGSIRQSASQDLMMMNNNYLPGVSRLNGTARIHFDPSLSNTALSTPAVNVHGGFASNSQGMQDLSSDTARISESVRDLSSFENQLNMAGMELHDAVHKDILGTVESAGIDTQPHNLCEHQGPVLSQNTNLPQSPGWSNIYNSGSLDQSNESNFTFTTPTQTCLYSPALTATTQNRFHYGRTRPQTFAPGCGSPWQHSPPKRLSSSRQRSFSSPQMLLSGSQSSSGTLDYLPESSTNTDCSKQMSQPVASCSKLHRRPKRRHTIDTAEDSGPRSKIHLTEEKIAYHMRELRIHNFSPPPGGVATAADTYIDTGQGQMSDSCYPQHTQSDGCGTELLKHSQRQWHDFRLLEDKLGMIDEDESSDEETKPLEPVVRVADGIQIQPTPVIPQDILEKIRNPCQEVVLWSPPNTTVKKLVASGEAIGADIGCESSDMMEESIDVISQSVEGTFAGDNGMETEPMDDMLEL